jgi:hypothetical protein
MTMTTSVAQLRITRDLHKAEAALDEALLRQSSLLTTMVSSRRDTAAGPFVGQEALLRLNKSQHALLMAASDLSRVHGKLLDIARETGSGNDNCPPNGSLDSSDEDLSGLAVVAHVA